MSRFYYTDFEEALAALDSWAESNKPATTEYTEPPWIYAPTIARADLSWRMGGYETYIMGFKAWARSLSDADRQALIEQYPEPEEWQGFYEIVFE